MATSRYIRQKQWVSSDQDQVQDQAFQTPKCTYILGTLYKMYAKLSRGQGSRTMDAKQFE